LSELFLIGHKKGENLTVMQVPNDVNLTLSQSVYSLIPEIGFPQKIEEGACLTRII